MSKNRNWCFTAHIKENSVPPKDWKLDSKYLFYAKEQGEEGKTPHWQGFCQMPSPRTLRSMKKKSAPDVHWEVMKGTWAQNLIYCTKEHGEKFERGERPKQGKRIDLLSFKRRIEEGERPLDIAEDETMFNTWINSHRALERYYQHKKKKRAWKSKVVVYWGPTGTGKSLRAFREGAAFVSFTESGSFLQGYAGEAVVCFDDFEDRHIDKRLFLRLTDRYPMMVNIKGGQASWVPRTIIFTSNTDPSNWYMGDPAVQRRLDEVVELTEKYEYKDGESGDETE